MSTSSKNMRNDRAHAVDNGAAGGVSGKPPFNLEFVNMNVASKAEKQMNQKVIRSMAMRSYRQKQQFQRTKDEETKIRNRARAVQPRSEWKRCNHSEAHFQTPESSHAWASEVDISDISWLVSASPSSNLSDIDSGFEASLRSASPHSHHSDVDSGFGESPHQGNALSDRRPRDFAPVTSPITLLGAGRIDPFRTSSSDTGPYIHELIDHCKSVSHCNEDLWLVISQDHC
ncbi:uncharacterized protein K444DRAFT_92509 [Hyaloscypha bicolor E]|uniref:Uncharacterized protein n=1 Tax=Hyaloscypha bicolor E TaxID=1095630 RepID=A0A2J6SVR1_9HELO|nr:uncharacterized protein K444DRAFT_92509 [Hyaloscypha bicolor E]PMD54860.1 hypothetical protein K444DRAFT_92509 [Hyaloscypha bicolor E]